MFNQKPSIVIVSREYEMVFANFLLGLVQEEGRYEAAIWSEKKYKDNSTEIMNPVVFLGGTNVEKEFRPSVKWRFDHLGAKYGWLGKRACILADDNLARATLDQSEIQQLAEKVNADSERFSEMVKRYRDVQFAANPLMTVDLAFQISCRALGWPPLAVAALFPSSRSGIEEVLKQSPLDIAARRCTVMGLRYCYAISEFHRNGLSEFMGDKP